MSIKAVGVAIKLTIEGENQAGYFQTWLFVTVSAMCLVIQLVYLNKVHTVSDLYGPSSLSNNRFIELIV